MRVRTISLAVTCVLIAASVTSGGSVVHAAKRQQTRRSVPKRAVTKKTAAPARRQVTHHELNAFLRSPAGKSKLGIYKEQALDVPRNIANPTGEKPFLTLRHQHRAYKTSGRLIKIASYATSVVTGAMGAFFGVFFGMPSGPELLQNPGVSPAIQALSQGHVLVGAIIGAAAAIVPGTITAIAFKRKAKGVEKQAENEAIARILEELATGVESQPPTQHPALAAQAGGGRQRDILYDFMGGPGSLFGPQTSASDRAARSDGISDVGPSGFDSFGPPGGPP